MLQAYINSGVQSLTPKLGLTKVEVRIEEPTTDAVRANADILDAAALIVAAPATATSTGKPGQIAFDATHFYMCVAVNTWVRALLATF
jgi:hypothetical protein